MGFLQGTLTVQRFLVLGPTPDDFELGAGMARERFRPFEDGSEEIRTGFADWRNPLIVPADPDWIVQGRYALMGLRVDTRKIPASLLKAHLDLKLQRLASEGMAFVSKEARVSLQDEVKAELLPKQQPRTKHCEVAWDRKAGHLLTTASGTAATSALASHLLKAFGVELVAEPVVLAAERVIKTIKAEDLLALDPFDLTLEVA